MASGAVVCTTWNKQDCERGSLEGVTPSHICNTVFRNLDTACCTRSCSSPRCQACRYLKVRVDIPHTGLFEGTSEFCVEMRERPRIVRFHSRQEKRRPSYSVLPLKFLASEATLLRSKYYRSRNMVSHKLDGVMATCHRNLLIGCEHLAHERLHHDRRSLGCS